MVRGQYQAVCLIGDVCVCVCACVYEGEMERNQYIHIIKNTRRGPPLHAHTLTHMHPHPHTHVPTSSQTCTHTLTSMQHTHTPSHTFIDFQLPGSLHYLRQPFLGLADKDDSGQGHASLASCTKGCSNQLETTHPHRCKRKLREGKFKYTNGTPYKGVPAWLMVCSLLASGKITP